MSLYDILTSEDVIKSIRDNYEYLVSIIPYIKSMNGFDQCHPHHHLDLWKHTLYALSLSRNDFDIRLSLLLHDIGKMYSYSEENGIRHYKRHALVSASLSYELLLKLGYSKEYANYICYLIRNHDNPISEELINSDFALCEKLFEIQRCDALAHNPKYMSKREEYINRMTLKLIR